MKLKAEIEDMLLSDSDELQAIYDEFTNPLMHDLADKVDRKTFSALENAVNLAVYSAVLYGFHVGFEFAQNPAAFIFEPDQCDADAERTTEELPEQPPQSRRDRPQRREYRERFMALSPEEQKEQVRMLRMVVGLLLDDMSYPVEAQAAQEPEDDRSRRMGRRTHWR